MFVFSVFSLLALLSLTLAYCRERWKVAPEVWLIL
jgi:hypothetical protein